MRVLTWVALLALVMSCGDASEPGTELDQDAAGATTAGTTTAGTTTEGTTTEGTTTEGETTEGTTTEGTTTEGTTEGETTEGGTTEGTTTEGTTTEGTTDPPPQCQTALDCLDFFPAVGVCEKPACEDGQCVLETEAGCCECTENADCGDGDPCTQNVCTSECGVCETSVPDEPCCKGPADCDDGNPCTVDICNEGTGECASTALDGCCTDDAECAVQGPCTVGVCQDNKCATAPDPECCEADSECDDNDDCTTDSCSGGTCAYQAAPGCCSQAADCDDGDPCTSDICFAFQCINSDPEEGCCAADGDCADDGNPCATPKCVNNACVAQPVQGPCCMSDEECEDGNACTTGQCLDTGECTFETVVGCCAADSDCDDKNACTTDLCFANQCLNSEPAAGCCAEAAECDDSLSCTTDSCTDGTCKHTPVDDANCCDADAECADDNICTADTCVAGQCSNAIVADCCLGNEACEDGNACTTDTCGPDGNCVYAPVAGCCTADDTCDDNNSCTTDSCQFTTPAGGIGTCQHAAVANCCDPSEGDELAHVSFVPGVVDGVLFNPQQGLVRWREDGNVAFAGPASMYFGNNGGTSHCGFNSPFGDFVPDGTATIPGGQSQAFPTGVLALPEGSTVQLEFWARLDVRPAADVDVLQLFVLPGGDADAALVWDKSAVSSDDYGDWVLQTVDLSDFAGKSINLRWTFDVVSNQGCAGSGPRIDEVSLKVSACKPPQGCQKSDDCTSPPNDCFAATGTCDVATGECSYTALDECCDSKADCDDKNVCTNDACIVGQCQHQQLLGCCASDDECATDSPCLSGVCKPDTNECTFVPVDGDSCCATVGDCEAGDTYCGQSVACEQNLCVINNSDLQQTLCDFVFTNSVDGWSPNSGSNYRWREGNDEAKSPSLSAFFGSNNENNYCPPFNFFDPSGTASFPGDASPIFPTGRIAFDASGKTTLTFSVWLDIRTQAGVDTLAIRLDNVLNDTQVVVWTKAEVANNDYKKWVDFTIDMTQYAPFDGRVQVMFDTVDAAANGGCFNNHKGPRIDDLKVVQSCNVAP